jgi:hypothetical protein
MLERIGAVLDPQKHGPRLGLVLSVLFMLAMFALSRFDHASPSSQSNVVTDQTIDQSSDQEGDSESPDQRLADYTHGLEVFTALLAMVSTAQIFFLIRADRSTKLAVEAATQQAKIAQETFEKIERPYLYITCEGRMHYDHTTGGAFVLYNVVNHGKIAAVIEDVIVGLSPSHTGEPDTGLHMMAEHRLRAVPVMGPGNRHTEVRAEPPGNIPFDVTGSGELTFKIEDNDQVFLQVQIFYRGPFTRGHNTLNTWVLDNQSNRFVEHLGWDQRYNHII